jgi:hypothetical protein
VNVVFSQKGDIWISSELQRRASFQPIGLETILVSAIFGSHLYNNAIAQLFAKKTGSASPYTHRTHLISHHPTSFSSDILNIVCRESFFHHVKNYLQQFMKSSGPSRGQPEKT